MLNGDEKCKDTVHAQSDDGWEGQMHKTPILERMFAWPENGVNKFVRTDVEVIEMNFQR